MAYLLLQIVVGLQTIGQLALVFLFENLMREKPQILLNRLLSIVTSILGAKRLQAQNRSAPLGFRIESLLADRWRLRKKT